MAILMRSWFYVGGQYVGEPGARVVRGQMYVERWEPRTARRPFPVVLVHGGGQTATNWMTTADGRPGWAELFVSSGYTVYLIDQPARGRSPWHPDLFGAQIRLPAEAVEAMFTATSELGDWPQAGLHTQWPGSGRVGDPVFDAFYASQVPFLADFGEAEALFRDAGSALLEKIGPAIVLTHSQGGSLGWVLADAQPQRVRATVAVEPSGPPFTSTLTRIRGAQLRQPTAVALQWGVTETPVAYLPPIDDPARLRDAWEKRNRAARGTDLGDQAPHMPALAGLSDVPVLVVTAEASYHADYDHLTVEYLRAAGVTVDALTLAENGIHGNGHMMMMESNSDEIAAAITDWLDKLR